MHLVGIKDHISRSSLLVIIKRYLLKINVKFRELYVICPIMYLEM